MTLAHHGSFVDGKPSKPRSHVSVPFIALDTSGATVASPGRGTKPSSRPGSSSGCGCHPRTPAAFTHRHAPSLIEKLHGKRSSKMFERALLFSLGLCACDRSASVVDIGLLTSAESFSTLSCDEELVLVCRDLLDCQHTAADIFEASLQQCTDEMSRCVCRGPGRPWLDYMRQCIETCDEIVGCLGQAATMLAPCYRGRTL